jgi:hypothetical protein
MRLIGNKIVSRFSSLTVVVCAVLLILLSRQQMKSFILLALGFKLKHKKLWFFAPFIPQKNQKNFILVVV